MKPAPSPSFAEGLPALVRDRVAQPRFQTSLKHWREHFLACLAQPRLGFVIWMATRRCNLRCRYCVLPHEEARGADLSTEQVLRVFRELAEDFDARQIMVGITGGEATLRPDLVDVVRELVRLGFKTVAVDSNGVSYGRVPNLLDRLVDAGMRCPTISVDGVGEAQRALRGDASAGALPWKAIEHVQKRYPDLGTTTICAASPQNLGEIEEVYRRFEDLGVTFARLSPIFPLGRAAQDQAEVLGAESLATLLQWLAEQRSLFAAGKRDLEIELIDDGWCGLELEGGLLRGSFFHCRAGLTSLGIEHDGTVVGCPVIHSGFNVQGHALEERVSKIWRERFGAFRDRAWLRQGECASCAEWEACLGGSMHNRGDSGALVRCSAAALRASFGLARR